MEYDYDRLRRDLANYLEGAYFIGGYAGAMGERINIENVSDRDLLEIAEFYGLDTDNYRKENSFSYRRR